MAEVTIDDAFDGFLQAAAVARREHRYEAAWAALEAAHVVGQRRTWLHVCSHVEMLKFAWRLGDRREVRGQVFRILGGAAVTWLWVPDGNTGRTTMSAFASAPLPDNLAWLRTLPKSRQR